MVRKKAADEDLLAVLERAVRDTLKSKDAKPSERIAAIQAGAKIALIRHKLADADSESFFK
jgi:hypothetical protein